MPIWDPSAEWVDLGTIGDDGIIQGRSTPQWITWAAEQNGRPYWNTTTTTDNYIIPTNYTSATGNWRYTWSTNMWSSNNAITIRDEDWYTVGYETPDPHPVFERAVAAEDREIERAAAHARAQYMREERERGRTERAMERALAIGRGEELLLSLLDEAQREAYRLDGTFEVIGSCGTLYRVHRGTSGNIEWIKPDGEVGGRLCAHPTMHEQWLPTEDVMLAQLLALQTDEPSFVRTANVHAGQRPPIGVT